ncbi:branched-chain amino acid ABC transporter permease [Roseomonas sp. CCTCC AB2023176]|uniref:branched-chain amino acid ABC transporter permease n=1 Tax=Roseomonas sp. CCTCC AB2023176 TaxID=3342640 RepID=UPI0035D8EEE7
MLIQLLNGLQFAMLLLLLSAGLSVIFGLMNFVNLAHGTLYMIGAYIGLTTTRLTGSFALALVAASLGTALVGLALYKTLFERLQSTDPVRQVLVTFGVIFVGLDAVRFLWGNDTHSVAVPPLLTGSVEIAGEPYPVYRLFIIAMGLAVLLVLHVLLDRTRVGAMVRAAVDHRDAAECLGVDVRRLFLGVFALGCLLAGLAGAVAAPVLSVYPGMEMPVLVLTLIIVVVGGPGSLAGAALGSVLIGLADTFGRLFLPSFAAFLMYAVVAGFLILRPRGVLPIR